MLNGVVLRIPSLVSKVVKFLERGRKMVVVRGWGEGEMGSYLMDTEFQFCKLKRFWRCHTTM